MSRDSWGSVWPGEGEISALREVPVSCEVGVSSAERLGGASLRLCIAWMMSAEHVVRTARSGEEGVHLTFARGIDRTIWVKLRI